MKYTIVVDKQPSSNPSTEKKEYTIDVEELRTYKGVSDALEITPDMAYVIRKLKLSEYGVLSILNTPKQENIRDLNIELFDGTNYIYVLNQQGNKITASYTIKNSFTDNYPTKIEMNSAITQNAQSIMLEVNKKVDEDEFATYLEVNSEAVKVAWNKITEFIQMEIINSNASLAIRDEAKKLLMSLDKLGQHFFNNNKIFSEMGVKETEDGRYLAFSVPSDYGKDITDGMAWGITTSSDNKFWPILYVKNFHMANKDAGDFSGEIVLSACNLVLEGINSAITCGGVNISNAGAFGGVMFEDANTHQNLLTIMPESSGDNSITILDKIAFFKNQAGSNSLKLGAGDNYAMLTDEGKVSGKELYISGDATVLGQFINPSLEKIKKNINKLENGLDIVLNTDIYTYNLKREKDEDKKHIGFVIGKKYKYSKEITSSKNNGANLYSMVSVAYKAIQEQQEMIKKQNKRIEELENKLKEVTNG